MIDVRQKGAEGEREVAKVLDRCVRRLMLDVGIPVPPGAIVQRNQNQSAVGGSDLSNTFGLCIEVKRQEQLAVNTWWEQAEAAAKQNGESPILLYRQSGKKWKCLLMASLPLPFSEGATGSIMIGRVEITWDDFQVWFEEWVRRQLANGVRPRV